MKVFSPFLFYFFLVSFHPVISIYSIYREGYI